MEWECPSCGTVKNTAAPFWDEKVRKNLVTPKGCPIGCGHKGELKLIDFKKAIFSMVPTGGKVIDHKGETLFVNTDGEVQDDE